MFWENFKSLCARAGESPNSVATKIGKSSGSVTGWKNGAVPQHSTIKKIADYFGVSTDYLLGKEKKTTQEDGLSEAQRKLIDFAKSVPEDKIDLILRVMQSIVEGN